MCAHACVWLRAVLGGLGRSWVALGSSWGGLGLVLGGLGSLLGGLGSLLGRLGALLGDAEFLTAASTKSKIEEITVESS